MQPLDQEEFAALMAALGPFESQPRLAVAVSGGPDSMALALLAAEWARSRRGSTTALIVDHGLRPEATAEAAWASRRLGMIGIPSRILPLDGLRRGAGLAERAREARYAALIGACRDAGLLHLLIGHHAGDQAETLMMRVLSGSRPAGLAGMPALVEQTWVRLLRPLLSIPRGRLRATLERAGVGWVEDPSNRDPAAERARLRLAMRDSDGRSVGLAALSKAALRAGILRAERERQVAEELAHAAQFHAEGFAVLRSGRVSAEALAALIRAVGGGRFPPDPDRVAALAAALRPATLGGVRVMAAGRLGPGFLLVREARALGAAAPAVAGAVWDRRFRIGEQARGPPGAVLEALGRDAARLRGWSDLPSAVLRVLPAVRANGQLLAVPHLRYPDPQACAAFPLVFAPPIQAAGAWFMPAPAHL